jgi:hypothetical protein
MCRAGVRRSRIRTEGPLNSREVVRQLEQATRVGKRINAFSVAVLRARLSASRRGALLQRGQLNDRQAMGPHWTVVDILWLVGRPFRRTAGRTNCRDLAAGPSSRAIAEPRTAHHWRDAQSAFAGGHSSIWISCWPRSRQPAE